MALSKLSLQSLMDKVKVFTLVCLLWLSSPVAADLGLAEPPPGGQSPQTSVHCLFQSPDELR